MIPVRSPTDSQRPGTAGLLHHNVRKCEQYKGSAPACSRSSGALPASPPPHQHAVVRHVFPLGGLHPKPGRRLLHRLPVHNQVGGAAAHKGRQAARRRGQRRQGQRLQAGSGEGRLRLQLAATGLWGPNSLGSRASQRRTLASSCAPHTVPLPPLAAAPRALLSAARSSRRTGLQAASCCW